MGALISCIYKGPARNRERFETRVRPMPRSPVDATVSRVERLSAGVCELAGMKNAALVGAAWTVGVWIVGRPDGPACG